MITETCVSSDEVIIEASAKAVWEVLIDFENYAVWNAFCPEIKTKLELGAPVEMMCDLGFGLQKQVEYMCRIEPEKAIAWRMKNEDGDPIHAVRTQYLEVLGDNRCRYVSIDEFSGDGAAEMLKGFGKNIEQGFNTCAYGLKKFLESR